MKSFLLLAALACVASTASAQTTPTTQPGTTSNSPTTNTGVQTAADHMGSPSGIVDANMAGTADANRRAANRTTKRGYVKSNGRKTKVKM